MSKPLALVTGATGFLGSNLCKELLEHGYAVRALCRQSSDVSILRNFDVDLVQGDISDIDSLRKAMETCGSVFHIAALFRQAKYPDSVYNTVNVQGTRNVLEAAEEKKIRRIVHCSTVGVHSHIPNPPADENEPFRPGDIYQATKAEGEKLAQEWFRSGRLNGTVIRPAMIWGPGDKRTLKLFKGVAKRRFPMIGTGRTLTHWVMVDDLARGFRLAAESSASLGQTYILAGEKPVTLDHLVTSIAAAFGVKPLPIRIPARPIQIFGDIVETICKPLKVEPPIYRRRVDFFTKTRAFNWDKAKRDLGYQPQRSFEEEVKTIAEWYVRNRWIERAQLNEPSRQGPSQYG